MYAIRRRNIKSRKIYTSNTVYEDKDRSTAVQECKELDKSFILDQHWIVYVQKQQFNQPIYLI